MPFGEYTVDTLKTLPVSEAFLQGRLSTVSETAVPPQGNGVFVSILLSAAVILFILSMRKFVKIFPTLSEGLIRWRLLENIEDSVSVSRDRTTLMISLLPAFCFMLSLYGIVSPDITATLTPGIRCLTVLGAVTVLLLLRNLLLYLARPRHLSHDTAGTLARLLYDFIILLTVIMATTAGISALFSASPATVRTIMTYETVFLFLLFLVRKVQIAGAFCANIKTFLYLCSPEILFVLAIACISIYL